MDIKEKLSKFIKKFRLNQNIPNVKTNKPLTTYVKDKKKEDEEDLLAMYCCGVFDDIFK